MRPTVLHVLADAPDRDALGGVAIHVAALAERATNGADVYTVHPAAGELRVERWGPRRLVASLPLGAGDSLERALLAVVGGVKADVVHVHSPLLGARALASVQEKTGVPFVLSLHDHALSCENYTLLERGERFCGIPVDLGRCNRCLAVTLGRPPGAVLAHRAAMGELVNAVSHVLAPSDSARDLVGRVHPSILAKTTVVEWGIPAPRARSTVVASKGAPLRVGVVGMLSREKGRRLLPALLAACRNIEATFHVFGATEGASQADLRRSSPRVVVHGAYRRAALAERLVAANVSVCLLPSVAPETFSLVLSEVLAVGIPVIVSDLGALAERVSRAGLGWTIDPFRPAELATLLAGLERDRERIDAVAARVRTHPLKTERAMAADHVALWSRVAVSAPARIAVVTDEPRAAWDRGVERARRGESGLGRAMAAVRRTDFYRDLPLRRVLDTATRKRLEALAARWLARLGAG